MLNQNQMKAHDKAQMKTHIKRLSQSSVENSVQCLIQCSKMRKKTRRFYSFLIHLLFVFLFISTCFEALQKSESACHETAR